MGNSAVPSLRNVVYVAYCRLTNQKILRA